MVFVRTSLQILKEQGHSVSSQKVSIKGPFSKILSGQMGYKTFRDNSTWENLLRGCSTYEINDQMTLKVGGGGGLK